jgi:hypothetical protein
MHWRNELQLVENVVTAHVTGVQNQLDACEGGVHVGPNKSMCIRDQADDMHLVAGHSAGSLPHRATRRCGTPR